MAKRRVSRAPASVSRPGKGSITAQERMQEDAELLFRGIANEVLHADRSMFDSLTAHERKLVVDWLSTAIVDGEAENAIHDVLWEMDYVRKPVDIDTFIHDDFYFGQIAGNLHPKWKEDLFEVFDPNSGIFEWVMTGAIGIGKGLATSDVVLTPDGWKKVGDVRVGDQLVGKDGRPTRVEGVFPRGRLPLYRVEFDDGNYVQVDGDHLWDVQTPSQRYRGQGYQTIATRDLMSDLNIGNRVASKKWHIPLAEPVRFGAGPNLPIPPYALGALIGDGGLAHGSIRLSSMDLELVERVASELGVTPKHVGFGCDYRLVRERGDRDDHPLRVLRDLGLCVRSEQKRIPRDYLFASIEDRWELLRGLMDTDGWVQNRGKSSLFSSASSALAGDVQHLVESLGGVASRHVKKTTHLDAHILDIRLSHNPFWLPRKAGEWRPASKYRPRRMIASITPDREDDVVCFKVAAPDGLFLARHFIVTHNTTLAGVGLAYKLYCMSCLRDPALYYGLLPGSQIIFGVYSITKRQVADTGYHNIRGYIDACPYFRQQFPRSTKIDSLIDFEPRTRKKLKVIPGSTELHALGLNLFAFLMDEVNFMRVKDNKEAGVFTGQAYDLYNATYTRLLSRFTRPGGTLPGMMFLLSSRNAQTSFLEEHLRAVRSGEHSKRTHISDYALWEVKNKRFTWPGFKVEVGDRLSKSRLLRKGDTPRQNARVVEVPWEYHKPFTEDIDQALRDIAGVATFNLSPLISDRRSVFDAVRETMVHPFTRPEVVLDISDDVRIEDHFMKRTVARVKASRWVPKLNPNCPRFIHVDIGLTGDALGFAMGHVAGMVKHERTDEEGILSTVVNPFIIIDLMLRVTCSPGGEVDLAKVRGFIQFLKRIYPIQRVTFDRFQSDDSIQILKKVGIESGHQSMDKTDEAYLTLRSALFDRRIAMYAYEKFQDELLDLERDVKLRRVGRAGRVDHPTRSSKGGKGSKDVSDAVAGVVWLCMHDERARQSVVEIEPASAAVASKRSASDTTPPKPSPRVGVARTPWDDLRANVNV